MAIENANPVSDSRSLEEAWETVNRLRLAWGRITVVSPSVSGGLIFIEGTVAWAYVEGSGELGPAAWQKLCTADQGAKFFFDPVSREQAVAAYESGQFVSIVDPKLQETASLNDAQKAALQAQQMMADRESFYARDERLSEHGFLTSDVQITTMGQAISGLGISQQQEELLGNVGSIGIPITRAPQPNANTITRMGIQDRIESLELALAENSMLTDMRIELIKIYRDRKKFKRARDLASSGFRGPGCNFKQREELWKLYVECKE
jgi:hypothetical protein